MSDQIGNYTQSMETAFTNLTRNLASWHSFASEDKELPIVSYRASLDGVKSLEVVSDLSRLPAGDRETVRAIFAQHHGAQVLQALALIKLTAEKFETHLTSSPTGEADTPASNEAIPEAEYPEGDHGVNFDQ